MIFCLEMSLVRGKKSISGGIRNVDTYANQYAMNIQTRYVVEPVH